MITKITGICINIYSDNDTMIASIEWIDHKGKTGRTEGLAQRVGDWHCWLNPHMSALFKRAAREGVSLDWVYA